MIPKQVINRIEVICRTFVWVDTDVINRKSQVSWKKVCAPNKKGGLNIIGLQVWNRANMVKNLWNLQTKADSLWIQWLHNYYMKGVDIRSIQVKQSTSWILKNILNLREQVYSM